MIDKVVLIFLILLFSNVSHAQYEDLLRNPDIVWVAEYTTDFIMNPEDEADYWESLNRIYPIQLQNHSAVNEIMGKLYCQQFLSEQIIKHAGRPGFQAYADSSTRNLLSAAELESRLVTIDTGTSCEPPFYLFFIRNKWDISDISAIRIRQVFWYDAKQRRFGSRFLAYAPVFDIKDAETDLLKLRKAYFWLKGQNEPPKPQNTGQFSYIFQTAMAENSPGTADFKVIKGSLDIQKIVREEVAAPSGEWLRYNDFQAIDTAQMRAICFFSDTTEEFIKEKETWGSKIYVVPRDLTTEIDKISFIQNWYYDDRRNRFYCRLVGWAPLWTIRDDEGEIRYRRRLFYQVYR